MFRLSDNYLSTEVDSEIVLLDIETGEYFGLNETAATILKLVIDGNSLDEVVAIVSKETSEAEETIRQDIAEYFESLVAEQILVKS